MKRALVFIGLLAGSLLVALLLLVRHLRAAEHGPAGGSGVIEGVDVNATSRIAARITKVNVREGDIVKRATCSWSSIASSRRRRSTSEGPACGGAGEPKGRRRMRTRRRRTRRGRPKTSARPNRRSKSSRRRRSSRASTSSEPRSS